MRKPRTRRRNVQKFESRRSHEWVITVAFVAFLVVLWQVLANANALPSYIVGPWAIVKNLGQEPRLFWSASLSTLKDLVPGFLIGSFVGIVLGLSAAVIVAVDTFLDPLIGMTYPLPKIALYPVLAVWIGFTDTSRIIMLAIATLFPVYIQVYAGARGIDKQLIYVARNAGATRFRSFRDVVLRATMPSIVVGLRIGLAVSFVFVFAVEAIGGTSSGLGVVIEDALQGGSSFTSMYTALLCFGVLGLLFDTGLARAGKRITFGQSLSVMGRSA